MRQRTDRNGESPAGPDALVGCGNLRRWRARVGRSAALDNDKARLTLIGNAMLLSLSAFVLLLAFWLLLSGYFTPFLIAAGIGSAIAVVLFGRRMEVVDREGQPIDLWRIVISYWPWLVKEIAKSGWDVSKAILHPRLPISPTLVRFKPSQQSVVGLVTHANSITLTPGTITVEARPGEFLVHALTRAGADGVVDSEMDRRITQLEEP
jgi:multicomponent Na+:H+ antiporter subunit E